jgi:riboflavin biosynthesis pyrimidine reductase
MTDGRAGGVRTRHITTTYSCLTHHPRAAINMEGGTTFHFVNEGIETALERAFEAADGEDVMLGGGASTIQQYLRAGLIDEMHLAIVPILLGGSASSTTSTTVQRGTSASSWSARPPSRTSASFGRRSQPVDTSSFPQQPVER